MGQSAPRIIRRARANRGLAVDRGPRARNPRVPSQGILDNSRASASRGATRIRSEAHRYKGEEIEIPNQEAADKILKAVEGAVWDVASVQQKEKRRHPAPPFTTSKLQQEAYNKLRFSAKRTMMLAQRLYEGVELGEEGSVALITYMRTDSVRVSNDALDQVREFIGSSYGAGYVPEKPNFYKSKKDAQEGHEAIRPTDVARSPEDVKKYLEEEFTNCTG